MTKTMVSIFGGQANIDRIFGAADDVMHVDREMQVMYDDVPDDLKEVPVDVLEVHVYPEESREKALAWLDRKHKQESI